tara:strand:+ start:2275 stop:2799 length:525 start_codon:yes stop_codon:yes gene_type:complete
MSLNSFTKSTDWLDKQYLNIGCNDIKCTTLEVGGDTVIGVNIGLYEPAITFTTGATATNIEAYYSIIGNKTNALLDMSIKFEVTVTASIPLYLITIPLPPGMTNLNTNNVSATGGITNFNTDRSFYSATDLAPQVAGGNTIALVFQATSTTLLPIPASGVKVAAVHFKASVVQA